MLFISASCRVPLGSKVDKSITDNFMEAKLIFLFEHLLGYRLILFLFSRYHLHKHRGCSRNNDPKNHILKITLHPIIFTEKIPQSNQTAYPENDSHHIVEGKPPEVHFHNPRHYGRKCTYDGKKARQDNGHTPSFFIKFLCTKDVFFLEKPVILPLQQAMSEILTARVPKEIP